MSAAFSSSPPRDKSRQHEHIAQILLRNSPQRAYATYEKIPCYEITKSVKCVPAEAPLLSQPPLNIASWLQVMPQRRGESLVTDTAACWRVKEQGSLVIPFRSPCGVLMVPWWSPCGPVAAFICIYHVQPRSRLDDSQKWITEVMGGFYWVDSWLADTPNHYSLSLTTPLPSGQNVFVPGATCKDACRGWPPQATDWIVGAFWCLLALEPPAAVWSIEISPKSIPNSQKQKQLPNTQWVKYVYCPALLTLEVGRARRNHSTNTLWKNPFHPFSKSVCNTVANIPEARAKGFSQRTAVRLNLHFIYLTYIIHISYVLYITYIFYTIFYTIFSRSTSTSTPSSSSISPTPPTSPTQSFSVNLIYMSYIIYNAYMTYIIIYITASSTSPTSSNLSNLTSLTTSSKSSTT